MIRYIGLDFETSGTDPWGDAVPIQIGMATTGSTLAFTSLIGRWDWSEFTWSEESERVHGLAKDTVTLGPPVWEVDMRAALWLIDLGFRNRMWNVTVGWNVAGFDRQFVTRWFPNLNRILSYRTVDLNALVFGRAGSNEEAYNGIKGASKKYAASMIGGEQAWHDAGYDAIAALRSFEYLSEGI